MKLLLPLLTLVGLALADFNVNELDAVNPPALSQPTLNNQGLACNISTISCHWSGPVDACCSPKYGLVVLAQQWAPGFGPADEFTLHGLWPDTCAGRMAPPQGCDNSRKASNIAQIISSMNSTLYNRMATFWPSNKGDNNWFWSHEWTKHGTCVSTLRPTCYGSNYKKYQDVVDYFTKVLDLRDQYDIFGALNLNGVGPGRYYNVETVRQAIQKSFGASAKLDCRGDRLSEVSLYFYVQGRDKYIPTNALSYGSCRGRVFFAKK
ncbi:ribonuclease T2-like protein [Mycotypha africana]|uniref:ribonuclease T2-like protein n=1 Tax=Mycotypha africana TaxID=64632 RepID=UPI0022FFFEC3|nr:ribonuclease T2-like protein [Mycotypha africana]KAI8991243.1 ribonuclease T2-like protein [Mycotypha africana]